MLLMNRDSLLWQLNLANDTPVKTQDAVAHGSVDSRTQILCEFRRGSNPRSRVIPRISERVRTRQSWFSFRAVPKAYIQADNTSRRCAIVKLNVTKCPLINPSKLHQYF